MILRVIDRDPTLPHQIVIGAGRTVSESSVSCNCLLIPTGGYKPMAYVELGEGSLQRLLDIYRDPANHNPHYLAYDPNAEQPKYNVEVK